MDLKTRANEISQAIEAMHGAWPFLLREIQRLKAEKLPDLIAKDDEQLRGRIKQLQELEELPLQLRRELEDINAALSDEDAAD
jgi:hypothetical protein